MTATTAMIDKLAAWKPIIISLAIPNIIIII